MIKMIQEHILGFQLFQLICFHLSTILGSIGSGKTAMLSIFDTLTELDNIIKIFFVGDDLLVGHGELSGFDFYKNEFI